MKTLKRFKGAHHRERERESKRDKIGKEKAVYPKLLHKRMTRKKDTKLLPSILSHKSEQLIRYCVSKNWC